MLFVIPKIITFNYEFIPQDLTEKERTKSEKIDKSWRSCLLTPFSNEPDMHEENEFWLTYGSYVRYPDGMKSDFHVSAYDEQTIQLVLIHQIPSFARKE